MRNVFTLNLTEEKKVAILDLDGKPVEEIELPPIFRLPVRKDLIRRAFHSAHTASKASAEG